MSRVYFGHAPLVVGPGIRTGVSIRYEDPRLVGADRIANALAGRHLYGAPVILLDFGTATTFDAVSAAGEYLGGAMAPGILISLDALVSRASKLNRVELARAAVGDRAQPGGVDAGGFRVRLRRPGPGDRRRACARDRGRGQGDRHRAASPSSSRR